MEWQPIETAPKDGNYVLLTGGEHDHNHWYGAGPEPSMVVGRWTPNYGAPGWMFANWDGDFRTEYLNPTHWMPLPEKPERFEPQHQTKHDPPRHEERQ